MPRLEGSEWFGAGGALILLVSLVALPWFAFSVGGYVAPGSDGDAFRWLDGTDALLLAMALLGLLATAVRYLDQPPVTPANAGVVTATAGLVAGLVIIYLIISPPDGGRDLFGPVGGDPGAGLTPRGGPVIGLLAAIVMFLAGIVSVVQDRERTRYGPRARPIWTRRRERARRRRRLRQERPPVSSPAPPPRPRPAPRPRPTQAPPPPEPEPAPSPPPPELRPKPATTPPGPPRLAGVSVEDLVVIGFTLRQAERIVQYREEGLVTSVADLTQVPGIARAVLDALSQRLAD